jgi:hypothetical protein
MNATLIRISLMSGMLITCPLLCADIVSVSLVSSTLTGAPGDILTFQGTLTNNSGADIFINGAGITLAGFGPFDSDVTDFILNATGTLSNGSSVGPTDFFTVTIPGQFATGQYPGILSVQGGPTLNDDTVLGTAAFQANVDTVPEPSYFFLTIAVLLAVPLSRTMLRKNSVRRGRPRELTSGN